MILLGANSTAYRDQLDESSSEDVDMEVDHHEQEVLPPETGTGSHGDAPVDVEYFKEVGPLLSCWDI